MASPVVTFESPLHLYFRGQDSTTYRYERGLRYGNVCSNGMSSYATPSAPELYLYRNHARDKSSIVVKIVKKQEFTDPEDAAVEVRNYYKLYSEESPARVRRDIDNLVEERNEVRAELDDLKEEKEETRRELAKAVLRMDHASAETLRLEEHCEDLREKLEAATEELESTKELIYFNKEALRGMRTEMEVVEKKMDNFREEFDDRSNDMGGLEPGPEWTELATLLGKHA